MKSQTWWLRSPKVLWAWLFLAARCASLGGAEPNAGEDRDIFDVSLEELKRMNVTGASKREEKISEAPAAVTILTYEDVKRFGYRTLGDLLQTVPGMSVSYDRNRALLGSRGFNPGDANNRVLILVDGHRVNHNLRDEAYIGTDALLDIDLIDTVEVIRGPGSVLYGNNAFFGVINIHTRRGRDLNTVEGSGEAGAYGTYKGRATAGKLFKNGVEMLVSGSYYTSEGEPRYYDKFFDTPASNYGVAKNADADMYRSFFGSVSYRDFTLEGAYLTRDKVNPTAPSFTLFNDPRSVWADQRDYINLKYAHSFPEVVDLSINVYYDRNDFSLGYPPIAGPFRLESDAGEWWGTEVQLSRDFGERLKLTVGSEYRDDFRQDLSVTDTSNGNVTYSLHRATANHGVYVQGDFMLLTNLHLNAGARYDQYGNTDPAFNPRVALIYNPWRDAAFKAIYGSAFRAPDVFELADPRVQDIRPERIESYELVYEQGFAKHLKSTASIFYNDIEGWIVFDNSQGQYRNVKDVSAVGGEVGLEAFWPDGFRGRVSYTCQEARNGATSKILPDAPEHMVKASVSIPLWGDKLFASPEILFASGRSTPQDTRLDPYAIVNFTLFSQRLAKGLELSASAYNLLDTSYADPSRPLLHQPGQDQIFREGRSYRFKLTYRF